MLSDIQRDFLQSVKDPSVTPNFLQHLDTKNANQRFKVYTGSITESLASALRDIYIACERLVGEDFFSGLAYSYIEEKNLSRSSDLGDYGESFADFVENFAPAKKLPYLADVCRLSWACNRVYRSPIPPKFDLERFSKIPEEEQQNIIFLLPPGSEVIQSIYPIDDIFHMCGQNNPESNVNLDSGGVNLFVWRDQSQVNISRIDNNEWQVIKKLMIRKSLRELELELGGNINIVELLPQLFMKYWIVDFLKIC